MSIRKLLLTSLLFTAFWAIGLAQNVVTVHGTVTNDEGDPQEDITILASAYFADSTVVMITMTTDGDGQYDGAIDSPGPNIFGWLEVSMVDCWGTTITQNFEIITGSEDFIADFLYCEDFMMDSCLVIILEEWHPGNELELIAWNPLGQNGIYEWSTGDSTESIFPQESGTYCVTATFPWGCTSTGCIEVSLDSNGFCFVYIVSTQENDSLWTLEANASGGGPFMYNWSTGDTTQTISGVGPGTYCVAVIDPNGCCDSTCIILDDFDFCEVYIWENPNGVLVAEGFGEPPLSYLWNTGETTQTIIPGGDGLYCVTATDVNGCDAESCYEFYSNQDSCFVYINAISLDSNTFALEAVGFTGAESWLYEWSTGETTQIIFPTDPTETYCVTLTDSEGCASSACFDFGNYCYSWINTEYIDTATAILSVWLDPIFELPGSPQPSYLWSNGETGPDVTVGESGEYCVTVTINDNCVTESCTYVDFDSLGMACSVWVYTFIDSSGNWVAEAATWGLGDFEYEWTNGETTPIIELESPYHFACVTVTSSFGCEAVACVDSIMQLCGGDIEVSYQQNAPAVLTAYVWSLEDDIELLWSTGETGYTIEVEEEGTYCVTINTPNCTYTTCADVMFWNSDSCGVWISYSTDPIPVEYTANPWGTSPFTYLWSNGDTSQTVIVDFGDPNLCVTVTDAIGCISTACTYPIDSCDISIYFSDEPVPSLHIESADPLAWVIWSTGDTSEWIEVQEPGIYCADVTTISGCFASVCYTIDSIPAGIQNIIEGNIFADTLSQAKGWVSFYAFNPNSGEPYTLVDSAQISPNGHYVSSVLPDGIYVAKAVMEPGTGAAEDFLPTYHFAGVTWQEATLIGLPTLPFSHDIFMIPTTGVNGGGIIAGFVTDGQNIVADEDEEERGSSVGLPNVELILKDAQGEPLNYAWTVEDGAYRFENLPWGTYRISYDIAGLISPDIWVTLSPENPQRLQVNIVIEGETVAVVDPVLEEIKLYPNPAKLEVNIPMAGANTTYEIQLIDMQGKLVKTGSVSNVNGVITIDVRNYAPGLYHINLNSNEVIYYGRFIKQD